MSNTNTNSNGEVKFVFYSGQKIPVPANLSVDEIKVGLSQMFPRLGADDVIANVADNGDVTFYVPAGEKGSDEPTADSAVKFVFYSGQKIPVPANLSVDEIKVGLSQMFPRLGADDVIANVADNGDVTFYVPAGEKGSDEPSEPATDNAAVKFVFYSGQKIPVPANLSVDEIKVGLSQMFPRLGADDVIANVADNGDVTFYVPAGEKGSDEPSEPATDNAAVKFVFYSGQKIPVPANLSVDEIKVGLSQMFPRLGADDVIANVADNGDVTFYVPAGEKGSDEPSEPATDNAAVKFVFYSGQKIPVPANLSVDEIKVGLSQMFPRLGADDVIANVADNGDVTFYVPAGEKGNL